MLQNIRDHSQGLAAKIFVGFIVLVFGLFGVDALVGTFINSSSTASVNGVDINQAELDNATQAKTQELIRTLGENFDPSSIDPSLFRSAALQELIQKELLFQAAVDSGMAISSSQIDLTIAQTVDFQVDGVFDNARAQAVLQSYGYTPNSYRSSLEKNQLLNQIVNAYSVSGFATELEIEQAAAITLQKRQLRYLFVDLAEMVAGVEITDEEIEEYYQSNQSSFMQEEMVALEYIEINKDDIFDEVEVSAEAIQAQYDTELETYQSQIERRASHILFEASGDEDIAVAKLLAEEVKSRIDGGESFEDMAAEFSNDLGSAQDGGDVGFTSGDNFVEEFEEALKALDVGGVSGPVETEFGVHLIKLTNRSATEIESFEDSKDRIARDLQTNEVNDIYLARADELNNLSFESLDLNDPAEILGLEKKTSALFGRSGGQGVTANSNVITAAFSADVLETGLNSELIRIDDSRSLVIRVVEHTLPSVIELAEVEAEINVILQVERAKKQVRSIGETIVKNINDGQNVDGLLAAQSINWSQVEELERANSNMPEELVLEVFAMTKPASVDAPVVRGFQLETGQYAIIELQSVTDGTMDDFDGNEAQGIENFIMQNTASTNFNDFLAGIEAKAKIIR